MITCVQIICCYVNSFLITSFGVGCLGKHHLCLQMIPKSGPIGFVWGPDNLGLSHWHDLYEIKAFFD